MDSVEERLNAIEEVNKSHFMELEERLNQIEDLLLLIQAENIKIKQQIGLGPVAMETLPEEIREIPKELEEIRSRLSESGITREEVESIIEERIKDLSIGEESVAALEKKLKQMIPKQEIKWEFDKKGFEQLKNEVKKDLEIERKRMDTIEDELKDLKREFKSKLEGLENIIYQSGKILSKRGMDLYVERILKLKSDIEDTIKKFNDMKTSFETMFENKKDVIEKLNRIEVDIERIDALISKAQMLHGETERDRNKIEIMKNTISSQIDSGIERMNSIKEGVETRIKTAISEHVGQMNELKALVEDKLELLEEKIKREIEKSEYLRTSIENKSKDLFNVVTEVEELYNKMNAKIGTTMDVINSKFEEKITEIIKYRDEIKEMVDELSTEADKIKRYREEIEHRAEEMLKIQSRRVEDEVKSMGSKIKKDLLDSLDERIREMNEKIRDLVSERRDTSVIDEIRDEVQQVLSTQKDTVREEVLIKFEKDFRKELDEIKREVGKSSKKLEQLVKDITINEIKKFSEEVDKTLPSFVTQELFEKKFDFIMEKIDKIEKPDIGSLEERISMLDHKIDEIKNIVNSVTNRVPVIVE